VHFEGVSSGTDITQGVKRYQAVDKETFLTKWASQLASAGEPADFAKEIVDRKALGRVLIYDAETPRPDKDSGSVTAFQYMKILSELGFRVTFVPQNLLWGNKHSRALQRLGVEVIFSPYETSSRNFVLERAGEFDMVLLSRAPIGGELIDEVRNRYPNLPIVFDTVDIHHLRMFRQYDLEQDWSLWEAAAKMKELELNAIRQSDLTLLVSNAEAEYLNYEIGPFPHVVLPLIYEPYIARNQFSGRKDVAFIGGFRHTPNVDAVEHLVQDIWPLFRKLKTGAKLHIVGSHMPKDFARFACEDIIPVGYVEHLEPYMEKIRLSVAPLRYGAGVKGKVGNSLRMAVPVVATSIALEGMGLVPDVHVKAASDPESFAVAMHELYCNELIWNTISSNGQKQVMKIFGVETAKTTLRSITNALLR
jgi:glycosyltransferase involved in cell wall biosynthesis